MGYRSQVVLAFDGELLPKFLDAIARNEETKRLVFEWRKSWDKEFQIHGCDDNHHCIIWDNIKWYDDNDTRTIENFVHDNPDDARFLRIGEDPDDSEDYGEFAHCTIYIEKTQSIEGIHSF
tara:strand:+ start:658 stop:1020 length:363 start_codon:yes stop_codon:yes gene_type:complete